MLFVNMCSDVSDAGIIKRDGGTAADLEITPKMLEGGVPGGMVYDGGMGYDGGGKINSKIVWDDSLSSPVHNIFSAWLIGGEKMFTKQLSMEAIKDTPENPVLVVMFNELSLFEGIPVYIKMLRVDDKHMIGALVSGACMFNGVELQRCNNSNLDTAKVGKVLVPESIFKDVASVGNRYLPAPTGSGAEVISKFSFNYSYTAVLMLKLLYKSDGSFSIVNLKEGEAIFDENRYNLLKGEAQKHLDEYVSRRAKEREERERQHREYETQIREKAEKAQKDEKEKKEMEESLKSHGFKVAKGSVVSNSSAEDFLAAVMAASVK